MRVRRSYASLVTVGVMLLAALFAVTGVAVSVANALHEEVRVCTVDDVSREVYTSADSRAVEQRVYTADCGIFTVEDSLLAGSFTSADLFRSVEPGSTYEFTTRGHRVGFLSWFPNVVGAEVVK